MRIHSRRTGAMLAAFAGVLTVVATAGPGGTSGAAGLQDVAYSRGRA